jgi:hypothetical protein
MTHRGYNRVDANGANLKVWIAVVVDESRRVAMVTCVDVRLPNAVAFFCERRDWR